MILIKISKESLFNQKKKLGKNIFLLRYPLNAYTVYHGQLYKRGMDIKSITSEETKFNSPLDQSYLLKYSFK